MCVKRKKETDIDDYKEMENPFRPTMLLSVSVAWTLSISLMSLGASIREARSRLTCLKFALTRIDTADLGICTRCNSEISFKCSRFMLDSIMCLRCSSFNEGIDTVTSERDDDGANALSSHAKRDGARCAHQRHDKSVKGGNFKFFLK